MPIPVGLEFLVYINCDLFAIETSENLRHKTCHKFPKYQTFFRAFSQIYWYGGAMWKWVCTTLSTQYHCCTWRYMVTFVCWPWSTWWAVEEWTAVWTPVCRSGSLLQTVPSRSSPDHPVVWSCDLAPFYNPASTWQLTLESSDGILYQSDLPGQKKHTRLFRKEQFIYAFPVYALYECRLFNKISCSIL